VSLTREDSTFTLPVRNNGIGLPGDPDIATTATLGLKLVNFLARHQKREKVGVNTKDGTVFTIRFDE
jgi:two-component sensor histidine kinase